MITLDRIIFFIGVVGLVLTLFVLSGCSATVAGGLVGGTTNGCPVSPRWEPVDYDRYPSVIVSHLPQIGADGLVQGYVSAVCVDSADARSLNPVCCEAFPHLRAALLEPR